MNERMAKAKFAIPVLAVALLALLMGLVFYPMANMETKGLSFALVSLDEGTTLATGDELNVGDELVDQLVESSEDDEDATIEWTVLDSKAELDEAMENNEYYGALVIPKNFSEKQYEAQAAEQATLLAQAEAISTALSNATSAAASSATGSAAASSASTSSDAAAASAAASAAALAAAQEVADEAEEVEVPALTFYLDMAKSPMIVTQMQSNIATMFDDADADVDLNVEVEVLHEGVTASDDDEESGNAMATMMSQQIAIMPLLFAPIICAILLGVVLMPLRKAEEGERWKVLGQQVAVAALATLVAALCVWGVLVGFAGIDAPAGSCILFFWLASFCVTLLLLGCFNIAAPLGAIVLLCIFVLGMCTGILPYEVLPSFYQDWVFPWAPQNYIGQGLRDILYMEEGAWNDGSLPMVIYGVIGIVLMAVAVPLKSKIGAKQAAA